MKKFLLILFLILLVLVIALAVFILTFNVDRYRPLIENKIQEFVGNPVRLDHISLGWKNGLAVDIRGLSIYDGPEAQGQAAISLERAQGALEMMPLLRRDIQIAAVYLRRPRLHIVRGPDEKIRIVGIKPPEEPDRKSSGAVPAPAASPAADQPKGKGSAVSALPFFIDAVRIEDAEISFNDLAQQPPVNLVIENLDLHLRNVSLTDPIDFSAKFSLWSDEPNIQLKGLVQLPRPGRPGLLEDVRLQSDLSQIQIGRLMQALPQLQSGGIENLKGQFNVSLDELILDPAKLASWKAEARFEKGDLALRSMGGPIQNITLHAWVQNNQIEVTRFSADLGGGSIQAGGGSKNLSVLPQTSLKISIQNLELSSLLPPPESPGDPEFHGKLSADFQGAAAGKDLPAIERTAAGEGRIRVDQPVLLNFNFLQEIFSRLSLIPGLEQRLRGRLPPDYESKLNERDTVFQPIQFPVGIQQGRFFFNSLHVVSDSFELAGSGSLRFDGYIATRFMTRIDAGLSQAMIRTVNELSYLADAEGRLEIPILIQGPPGDVQFRLDLAYLASRLAAAKLQDVFSGVFRRPETATQTGTAQQSPLQTLLGSLLPLPTAQDNSAQTADAPTRYNS